MPHDLHSPELRQERIRNLLSGGQPMSATALADRCSVSADTIRRDLVALAEAGLIRRVRGGAVARPAPQLTERQAMAPVSPALAAAALPLVEDGMVLIMDGGRSVASLAEALPPLPSGLVVTPSPAVAIAAQARGTPTLLIGGRISGFGGIAVGGATEAALAEVAADWAFLGACGVDPEFGLSADDLAEAGVKRAMAMSARRAAVIAPAERLGRRARHRVITAAEIAVLITDAPPAATAGFAEQGIMLRHAT